MAREQGFSFWEATGQLYRAGGLVEQDVDLADKIDEAPAEHNRRLKTTPGGVEEGDPREYTTRQKVGLVLGPVLFLIMLLAPTPTGMLPGAQKMAAVRNNFV